MHAVRDAPARSSSGAGWVTKVRNRFVSSWLLELSVLLVLSTAQRAHNSQSRLESRWTPRCVPSFRRSVVIY